MHLTRSVRRSLGQPSLVTEEVEVVTQKLGHNYKVPLLVRRGVVAPSSTLLTSPPVKKRKMDFTEWLERPDHPLMNDLVMSMVFDNVEAIIDLKTCRLVCKRWNTLTLQLIRSRCKSVIGGRGTEWEIESFVKLMEGSTILRLPSPFGRFHISCQESTHEHVVVKFAQLCESTVQEYILTGQVNQMTVSTLLKSSPNLTTLGLPCTLSAKNKKTLRLFPIERKKPSLKFLKILQIGHDKKNRIRGNCPTYFDELFGVAQGIKNLSLESNSTDPNLKVLNSLLKFGKIELIQSLKLGHVTEAYLDLLKEMNGLKLKHLDLCINDQEEYFDWFGLLELFKDDLISLQILTNSNSNILFPPMPKLKDLKLVGEGETRVRCFGNECFNSAFPSLTKLFISLPQQSNESLFNDFLIEGGGRSSSSPVKSLVLQHYPKVSLVVFYHLQSTFNFSTLKMLECTLHEDAEVVRQIWTHMTQLEGLKMYGNLPSSEDINSLITGIPVNEIRELGKIRKCFQVLGKMKKKNREKEILRLTAKHCKLPSIHNLTNLKSLQLNLCGRETKSVNPTCLTDLSGYLGLYSLRNLQHLCVLRCKISDDCARALVDDRRLKSWEFKFQSRESFSSNHQSSL